MIGKGIYAAGLSVINKDYSLNVEETVKHAERIIKNGCHGVFFFGSTGQSQLISITEKKELVSSIATHRLKKQFFLGTGCNSFRENLDLIKYSMEFGFNTFLLMPPAYYKGNTNEGVYEFYKSIINRAPKIKIILYNFEKLSGFLFNMDIVKKLKKDFPKNIIGCKDSSYNLYKDLKIKDFLIFPGSEAKLQKALEQGCSGSISATLNVTHFLARKVFDDYEKKQSQTAGQKLISVREVFDNYNLISSLHSFLSTQNKNFENLIPPLVVLNDNKKKELIDSLNKLHFTESKNIAA